MLADRGCGGVADSAGSGDGSEWRVFISHTSELREFPSGVGVKSYIDVVERAVIAAEHVVVDMTDFPAADQPAAQLCTARVRGCDVYMGVLGTRYGSPVQDKPGVSYTELEFDTATEAGLDRLMFLMDIGAANLGIPPSALIDREFGSRQDAFRGRVQASGLVLQSFSNPDMLGRLVAQSLQDLAKTRRRIDSGVQREPGPMARPTPAGAVPRATPYFTGRGELLARLREQLGKGGLVVLTGMAGVGKTQLAVEYQRRYRGDYHLIWWVRAEQPTLLVEDYAALADDQQLLDRRSTLREKVTAVRRWLEAQSHWLLIFDNATDAPTLDPYLPASKSGHTIVTSQDRLWDEAGSLEVGSLSPAESVAFLREHTGSDEATAKALAAETGNLPLALEQARAYLRETRRPAVVYLERLSTDADGGLLAEGSPAHYEHTVATAWSIALDQIRRDAPVADELLALWAYLAPDAIPRSLVTDHPKSLPRRFGAEVANQRSYDRAVSALGHYSLVAVTEDAVGMHRLVQKVVRERLDRQARKLWARAAVNLVANAFPSGIDDLADPDQWWRCAQLLSHALVATHYAQEERVAEPAAGILLMHAGSYLERRGEYTAARVLLEQSLALVKKARGPDHIEVAWVLNALGYLLQEQGELAAARRSHKCALAINEAQLKPRDADIGMTLNNLGRVLYLQRNLSGARRYLERALTISKAAAKLGPDHPEVASILNNLGLVLHCEGELAEARRAHQSALAIKEAAAPPFGPNSPSVGNTLNYLGVVLRDLGELSAAEKAHRRALAIFKDRLPPNHPDLATTLDNLGVVLRDLGELSAAQKAHQRALAIFKDRLPPNHRSIRDSQEHLETVLRALEEQADGAGTQPPNGAPPRD
jgi:tetratricopeptide (TPR) repeat protein